MFKSNPVPGRPTSSRTCCLQVVPPCPPLKGGRGLGRGRGTGWSGLGWSQVVPSMAPRRVTKSPEQVERVPKPLWPADLEAFRGDAVNAPRNADSQSLPVGESSAGQSEVLSQAHPGSLPLPTVGWSSRRSAPRCSRIQLPTLAIGHNATNPRETVSVCSANAPRFAAFSVPRGTGRSCSRSRSASPRHHQHQGGPRA